MKLQPIRPEYTHQAWPTVGPMLERGLAFGGGEYNVDQLKVFIAEGRHILLVAVGDAGEIIGAATVAFEDYPNDRIAFITSVSGRGLINQELFGQLKEWCGRNGATKIRGAARESVARLYKQKLGFKQRYIITEYEL